MAPHSHCRPSPPRSGTSRPLLPLLSPKVISRQGGSSSSSLSSRFPTSSPSMIGRRCFSRGTSHTLTRAAESPSALDDAADAAAQDADRSLLPSLSTVPWNRLFQQWNLEPAGRRYTLSPRSQLTGARQVRRRSSSSTLEDFGIGLPVGQHRR
eukprot:CAMPEP_0197463674 /NCGR_PEP_ID=MMETSP1175-20131217/62415_1 /TAXON_ID=1003142 /ORGANISM="Triceratium dubium, Strain CCMP147" /LENGTH=152 /DNA_ID=CAMNT_0042999491 /DNA_START=124 /DNA_END=583 /DNA_ORIENTATION=-